MGISGYRQTGTTPDIVRKMVEKHILNPVLKEIQDQSYYEGNRREFGEFPTESGDTLILLPGFIRQLTIRVRTTAKFSLTLPMEIPAK